MVKLKKQELQHVKINLPGGFVSVGDFKLVLEGVYAAGVQTVKIGTRQQLLFIATTDQMEDIEYQLFNQELQYEVNENLHPNIVSSYVSESIYNQPRWLREGIYKDILTSFDFTPELKINIVDANQSFVPHYTGHLNFVSSTVGNYWHVYIRWPRTNQVSSWSLLVYSMDIAGISRELERMIIDNKMIATDHISTFCAELELKIKSSGKFHFQQPSESLPEYDFHLPYYEGFNRYDGKYWLGIYRPDESYSVSFLLDVCKVCQASRVGQIYTTPWRSLIIKDILQQDRKDWEDILDRHRINLRHASNELNWQIEDWCEPALNLKRSIVRSFDIWNLRTYRLCFGIKIGSNSGIWGSVIIKLVCREKDGVYFDVFHTQDFKANSHNLVLYKSYVLEELLPLTLKTLCDCFYDATLENRNTRHDHQPSDLREFLPQKAALPVFRCSACLSIYDPAYGDSLAAVEPGTTFEDLPADYTCGICGAVKEEFTAYLI